MLAQDGLLRAVPGRLRFLRRLHLQHCNHFLLVLSVGKDAARHLQLKKIFPFDFNHAQQLEEHRQYARSQRELALGFTARWRRLLFVITTADLVKYDEGDTRLIETIDVYHVETAAQVAELMHDDFETIRWKTLVNRTVFEAGRSQFSIVGRLADL